MMIVSGSTSLECVILFSAFSLIGNLSGMGCRGFLGSVFPGLTRSLSSMDGLMTLVLGSWMWMKLGLSSVPF